MSYVLASERSQPKSMHYIDPFIWHSGKGKNVETEMGEWLPTGGMRGYASKNKLQWKNKPKNFYLEPRLVWYQSSWALNIK